MNKIITNLNEAFKDIKDGVTLLVGGFDLCKIPEYAIAKIKELGVKNLTIVSNNCGVDDFGLGLLLQNRQIQKIIASYVGKIRLLNSNLSMVSLKSFSHARHISRAASSGWSRYSWILHANGR